MYLSGGDAHVAAFVAGGGSGWRAYAQQLEERKGDRSKEREQRERRNEARGRERERERERERGLPGQAASERKGEQKQRGQGSDRKRIKTEGKREGEKVCVGIF
jgi:hypothetical protein